MCGQSTAALGACGRGVCALASARPAAAAHAAQYNINLTRMQASARGGEGSRVERAHVAMTTVLGAARLKTAADRPRLAIHNCERV